MECANCKVSGLSFKRCKGCYRVYYCSKKCQTDDWLEHRLICSKQAESIEDRNQTLEKDLAVKVNAGDNTRDKMIDESFRSENSLCISVEENRISNLAFEETRMNNDQLLENSTSSDAMMKQMQKEPKGWKEVTNEADIGEKVKHNFCTKCGVPGCVKKCSRCKDAFYCSVPCQQKDWKQHKRICKKVYTDEELSILKALQEREANNKRLQDLDKKQTFPFSSGMCNYTGDPNRFYQMLSLEQALILAKRPEGSLRKAIKLAEKFYPRHKIITTFTEVPSESVFPFVGYVPRRTGYVLVAFMYRYHEHVMRHGVYLKDANDRDSKVEFYLDHRGDNPFPFFSYSQVKPGGYICLQDPVTHIFGDRSVGIRIDDPSEVRVLDIEKVKEFEAS